MVDTPLAQLLAGSDTSLSDHSGLLRSAKSANELHLLGTMTSRRHARLYGVLALLRILIAFTSTSSIHPDEHFQNPEIAANTVFSYAPTGDGLLRTWEWRTTAPCRSIVPVLGSTGWLFALSKLAVGNSESAARSIEVSLAVLIWSRKQNPPATPSFSPRDCPCCCFPSR